MQTRKPYSRKTFHFGGVVLCGLSLVAGCGDDDDGGDVVTVGPRDGGAGDDGARSGRGGGGAGGQTTGGASAGEGGAGDTDAGEEPAKPDAGSGDNSCALSAAESEYSVPVPFGDEYGFAVAPAQTGFGLVYQAQNDCKDAVSALTIAATGPYGTAHDLLGNCALFFDIGLVHLSDGGYRMAWVDNSSDGLEVHTLELDDGLVVRDGATPQRITNNKLREQRPTLWRLGAASYLGWIAYDADRNPNAIMLQDSAAGGSARAVVADSAGYRPTGLAFAQLGADRGALAFVSEPKSNDDTHKGIWLLPLDTAAAPVGNPVLLSAAVTGGQTVDLTTRTETGGAVVYSIDLGGTFEVRFRRLDALGAFSSDEIKLATGAFQARDAGIARLGDGYVVAFRTLPTDTETKSAIRLLFVTKDGNLQRDSAGRLITYFVADAGVNGGRVSVKISTDGQLLISFVDDDGTGKKLRVLRKRLDCAL